MTVMLSFHTPLHRNNDTCDVIMTWVSHGCHMIVTWVSHGYLFTITTLPLHVCDVVISYPLHRNNDTFTDVIMKWVSHEYHMGVTSVSHRYHIGITWISHGYHMDILLIYQPYLCMSVMLWFHTPLHRNNDTCRCHYDIQNWPGKGHHQRIHQYLQQEMKKETTIH